MEMSKTIIKLAREVRDSDYLEEGAPGWKGGPERLTALCDALIEDFNGASNAKHSAFTTAIAHFNAWRRRNDLEEVEVPREYTKWITTRVRGEETLHDDDQDEPAAYLEKVAKEIIRETDKTGCIILLDDGTSTGVGMKPRQVREALCAAIADTYDESD